MPKRKSPTNLIEIKSEIYSAIMKLDTMRIREARPPCGWIISVPKKSMRRLLTKGNKGNVIIVRGMTIPVVVDKEIPAEQLPDGKIHTEIWIGQIERCWADD